MMTHDKQISRGPSVIFVFCFFLPPFIFEWKTFCVFIFLLCLFSMVVRKDKSPWVDLTVGQCQEAGWKEKERKRRRSTRRTGGRSCCGNGRRSGRNGRIGWHDVADICRLSDADLNGGGGVVSFWKNKRPGVLNTKMWPNKSKRPSKPTVTLPHHGWMSVASVFFFHVILFHSLSHQTWNGFHIFERSPTATSYKPCCTESQTQILGRNSSIRISPFHYIAAPNSSNSLFHRA